MSSDEEANFTDERPCLHELSLQSSDMCTRMFQGYVFYVLSGPFAHVGNEVEMLHNIQQSQDLEKVANIIRFAGGDISTNISDNCVTHFICGTTVNADALRKIAST